MQYIDQMIDVGFAGRAVPRCCRGGDSRAPTIAAAQVSQLQYFFVVDVPVVQVHLGVQLWTGLLTCPSLCNDRVFHSGGATDTVHRLFMWTFSCATQTGTTFPAILLMAAMMGLTHFASFFALLQLCRS